MKNTLIFKVMQRFFTSSQFGYLYYRFFGKVNVILEEGRCLRDEAQ